MKKNNKKYTFLTFNFIVIFFFACSTSNKQTEVSKVEITSDSIIILTDNLCEEFYNYFTIDNDSDQFWGYNSTTNALDIFDLGKGILIRHINLEKEGPNGITGEIKGLYFHNNDSIFAYSPEFVYIIDAKARIIDKINLRKYTGRTLALPIINENFKLKYFTNSKEIYFQNFYPTEWVQKYLDSSLVSVFNLEKRTLKKLPIKFSDYYTEKEGRVGFLRWMNFETSQNDSLFFNSRYDDEMTIYNKKLNKIENVKLNQWNSTEFLDINAESREWINHAIISTHRFAFIYDKWRNVYYRFVWEGIPIKISDKYYNSMLDKPLYLEIYNDGFQILKKIKFPDYCFMINTWFVTEKGLYISPSHPQSKKIEENKMKFEIFKVKVL